MVKVTEIVRTSLRMNRRLYDRLAEAADQRGLTMHAEIIRRLNETLEMDDYVPKENIYVDDGRSPDLREATRLIDKATEILRRMDREDK